ncbi:hypothetical protein [Streptomyces sp. NBC_00648]|uniref:hypothetical protein n=1 Tax=Streptomyces sp. NBC_00648 TaxID=2975797 RepID=UPI00324B9548
MTRRHVRQLLCATVALGLLGVGGTASASAATISAAASAATTSAAHATPAVAACTLDTAAHGLAGSPVAGSLLSVPRADGRVDEFQLFYDSTATGGLPFVWHRGQSTPGGAYGPWTRVSAATVGPKAPYVTAAENTQGRIELLFATYGQFCHVVEVDRHGWTAPEPFGLAPGPYMGGVVLFKERDGSLDAFASTTAAGRSMEVRTQRSPSPEWGPAQSMGKVPDLNVGLSRPSTVTELPDGRLHVTVREWNRDRYWQNTQLAAHGTWGAWELCGNAQCT